MSEERQIFIYWRKKETLISLDCGKLVGFLPSYLGVYEVQQSELGRQKYVPFCERKGGAGRGLLAKPYRRNGLLPGSVY